MKLSGDTMAVTLALLLLSGCYSSTTDEGDAGTDPGTDTHVDPGIDPGSDTHTDPWHDPGTDTSHDPWVEPSVDPIYDPGTDSGPACPSPSPWPEGPTVDFTVDGTSWPGWVDLFAECTVETVEFWEAGGVSVSLSCWEAAGIITLHDVEILGEPYLYIPLWEGQQVQFRYLADPVWWINEWFRISYSYDDRLIVGGMKADAPNPPVYEDFWYPLGIWTGTSECPLTYEPCYDSLRTGLTISYEESIYSAFDSNETYIGPWGNYGAFVDTAVERTNFRCTDVPSSWFTALIFESGWD